MLDKFFLKKKINSHKEKEKLDCESDTPHVCFPVRVSRYFAVTCSYIYVFIHKLCFSVRFF